MSKDLTVSDIDRQNILNNRYALQKMQDHFALGGVLWQGHVIFTKAQVAELLEVDERTIDRYLDKHNSEISKSGYWLLKGKDLIEFKEFSYHHDIDVGIKTARLSLFSFRAVLNLAMLLTESEHARHIRSRMLDIVIDVIAERAGGHTKYINQRDEGYLLSDFQQKNYRKVYITALDAFVEEFKFKLQTYTNKLYTAIFRENATEYRKILKLQETENVRDTMYSEVLDIIASFENGLAHDIEKKYKELGRKLTSQNLKEVFDSFVEHPTHTPLVLKARTKMASRDLCFRDALHHKLREYIQTVPEDDFERFLGEKSKELEAHIAETREVFKRLKDR